MREYKGDWRDLFFGFRIALDLRKMFLGLLGLVFSFAGVLVIMFIGALPKEETAWELVKDKEFYEAFYVVLGWVESSYMEPVLQFCDNPGRLALFPSTEHSSTGIWPWLVLSGALIWLAFVWSKFGGAISRITAVEIAKDERITIHESLDFNKKKFTSYFWSTVAVAVAFLFFFLVNVLGGLVGAIPYAGPVLVAVLSPFAFLGGFIMLLIAIGGVFGWPLMSPAIAAEGTDAFDAVSRAFSYIYTKPWQYLFYWIVTAVYGVFSIGFVWLFSLFMVRLTLGSAHIGMGKSLDPVIDALFNVGSRGPGSAFSGLEVPQGILFVVLGTVIMIIYGLAFAYGVSYFYTARGLMYFILRKKVDNTEMTEVFMEEEQEDEFFTEELGGGEKPKAGECEDAPQAEPQEKAGDEAPKPETAPTPPAEQPKEPGPASQDQGGEAKTPGPEKAF